jgi:hypothetical protein
MKGDTGNTGMKGDTGSKGDTGATGNSIIFFFASNQSIPSGQYIGLGTSGVFISNNIVVPVACTATLLVFNTRDGTGNVFPVTGTLVVRPATSSSTTPIITSLTATVNSTDNNCSTGSGSVALNQCDIIAIQIITSVRAPALSDGAAVTIVANT